MEELGTDIPNAFSPSDLEGRKDSSASELIDFLKSAVRCEDFGKAEEMLRMKEEEQKACERRLEELENEFGRRREGLEKELEGVQGRCAELEEKNKRTEKGFRVMIVEIEKKEREGRERVISLEATLGEMEFRKFAVEEELEKHKRLCSDLEERIVRLEEDHRVANWREQRALEKVAGLELEMKKIEQEVQEKFAEKRRADIDIADYKRRCGELETRVLQLEEENSNLQGREQDLPKKKMVETKELLSDSCYEEEINKESCRIAEDQNEVVHAFADVESVCHTPVRESTPQILGTTITGKDPANQVRRKLLFNGAGSPDKKETPVRVNCAKSSEDIVVIFDSDDEIDIVAPALSPNVANSGFEETYCNMKRPASKKSLKRMHSDLEAASEENVSSSEENITLSFTPKRKHASQVITSDNEGEEDEDDDDKIPLARLKMKKLVDVTDRCLKPTLSPVQCSSKSPTFFSGNDNVEKSITPSRRRIIPLRQCEETKLMAKKSCPSHSIGENLSSKTDNGAFGTSEASYQTPQKAAPESCPEEDEVEQIESDSEGESLGGFIIQESDGSESEGSFTGSFGDEEESGLELNHLLERIRRKKKTSKWEYEADMLSSFSKDPELCMKAVCALYRQQTSDEKSMKGSLYANNRGFNKFDALKGSLLAEFLTDGDAHGPLKKSVEELEKHDPKALEYCSQLASRYSKQLFEIYKNKEDPHFLPC